MSRWDHKSENRMTGRVVKAVALGADRDALDITFADGSVAHGRVEGDCCSQTWIEHLTVPPDVEGATVTGYVWSETVPQGTPSVNVPPDIYLDEVEVYSEAIQTTRGEIVIEYRNSSNGYYGGSLEWTVPQ